MWRFVLVSFVFLGWIFYVLSGGAAYKPAENSIQVQGRKSARTAEAETAPARSATESRTIAQVEAMMAGLQKAEAETERLSATLNAARRDGAGIIEAEASRPKAELLALELPERKVEDDAAVEAAIAAAIGQVGPDPDQLRWVKENVVDLRSGPGLTFDKVAEITKGTEVAVLEDPGHGWLNVRIMDTYQTGWLAEWLVKKPE